MIYKTMDISIDNNKLLSLIPTIRVLYNYFMTLFANQQFYPMKFYPGLHRKFITRPEVSSDWFPTATPKGRRRQCVITSTCIN